LQLFLTDSNAKSSNPPWHGVPPVLSPAPSATMATATPYPSNKRATP
jgi:hypothetical protein